MLVKKLKMNVVTSKEIQFARDGIVGEMNIRLAGLVMQEVEVSST